MPTLCLVMIVKDSGSDIIPVLQAIRPYITCYCISDTGSIDDTPQTIARELSGIRGSIHSDVWVDFTHNRNTVIEYAEREFNTDFYIMLDDSYVIYGAEQLHKQLETFPSGKSANYLMRIYNKEAFYYSGRVFTKGQRYHYRVHEVFKDDPSGILPQEIYLVDEPSALHAQRSKDRYRKDIELLLLDKKDYPNDPRPTYYLGKTYYSLLDVKNASVYFSERIKMAKTHPSPYNMFEVYNSMFYLGIIAYQKFLDTRSPESYENCVKLLEMCHKSFPQRAEPLFYISIIMTYFDYMNKKDEIIKILEHASTLPVPEDNDIMYDVYFKKIPYSLAFAYYRTGRTKEAIDTIHRFYNPDTEENIKFDNLLVGLNAMKSYQVAHYSEPVVVIYATSSVDIPWNGSKFNYKCSGSEYMAVRLAEFLAKTGRRVFLFCVCDGLEGEVNGVEYMPINGYYSFLKKNYIDLLIVSRDSTKLSYLKHIKNTYLWVHDLQPIGDEFQTGPSFRGVVVLTDFHKKKVQEAFPMPDRMFRIIGNTISPNPSIVVQKKPLQFIYSSSPDRGLDVLLRVFEKLVVTFPTATLKIYANSHLVSPKAHQIIRAGPSRYQLHPRVGPEELHQAYAESEYWLYPTNFEETYCITAVEAQYYKCVCVTTTLGSLSEIVGQRGVLLKSSGDSLEIDEEILKKITFLENTPSIKEVYQNKGHEWAKEQTIEKLGGEWIKGLE